MGGDEISWNLARTSCVLRHEEASPTAAEHMVIRFGSKNLLEAVAASPTTPGWRHRGILKDGFGWREWSSP